MSTSIVVTHENGTVGRLGLFDETDKEKPHEIAAIADRWRSYFGPAIKIEVIQTNDKKCRPNFRL